MKLPIEPEVEECTKEMLDAIYKKYAEMSKEEFEAELKKHENGIWAKSLKYAFEDHNKEGKSILKRKEE